MEPGRAQRRGHHSVPGFHMAQLRLAFHRRPYLPHRREHRQAEDLQYQDEEADHQVARRLAHVEMVRDVLVAHASCLHLLPVLYGSASDTLAVHLRDPYGPCGDMDDHGDMQDNHSVRLGRLDICIRLGPGCDGDGHGVGFDGMRCT